ncbi:hypothetical protein ACO34A_26810 (plasmid) [Rhizobium sp. ACO-34A]|nr:DUF3313 domain-containing protein [Rhizobium sp. ACO-34A]ATN37381.1 hypothetical protein ACO34A_26810 [Rhizobium sp. ACO-34A]
MLAVSSTALAGCTTASPTVYSGLSSAAQLQPNPQDKGGRMPYRYKDNADWRQYDKIIVDPVTVYGGSDSQFVKVEEKDKAILANYMREQFTEKLRSRFAVVNEPGPGTLRLHLTLTGAKLTTPVLGPFSHLDIGGGVYNTVQAARDREGTMTGSVNYAVEIYDAESNRLLHAYVTKQYPNAMNVGATFSALEASKVGIRKGADALLSELR